MNTRLVFPVALGNSSKGILIHIIIWTSIYNQQKLRKFLSNAGAPRTRSVASPRSSCSSSTFLLGGLPRRPTMLPLPLYSLCFPHLQAAISQSEAMGLQLPYLLNNLPSSEMSSGDLLLAKKKIGNKKCTYDFPRKNMSINVYG